MPRVPPAVKELSLSLLDETCDAIKPQDSSVRSRARDHLEKLAMPQWALGRVMDIAVDLVGMTCSLRPAIERKRVVLMAGDHGVTDENVSKYPRAVTEQMMYNFVDGGAGINALAGCVDAELTVVDMGVAAELDDLVESGAIVSRSVRPGTDNIAEGPAMRRDEAVRAVEGGIEVANDSAQQVDVFGTGDMGIGNTTPSAAIAAAATGLEPSVVTGRGTGIDDEGLQHKIAVVDRALTVNAVDPSDGLDLLSKVGGFEIGGIAGVILGAASQRKPVVVDGFISTAGAIVAQALCPDCTDYMIAAHRSEESGHAAMHELLGKQPLLDLGLRLGEGTGAALAMNLVDAAASLLTEVNTFEEVAAIETGAGEGHPGSGGTDQ